MKRARKLLILTLAISFCLTAVKVDAAEKVYNDYRITASTFGDDGKFIRILYLGPNVAEIDPGAASALPRLQKIVVDSDNASYSSFDGCLYNKSRTKLLYMPPRSNAHWYPSTMSAFTASSLSDTSGGQTNAVQAVIDDNSDQRRIAAEKKAEEAKAEAEKKKAEAEAKKKEEDAAKKKEAEEKAKKEEEEKTKQEEAQKKAAEEAKANTCIVAFDPNGGTGSMSKKSVTKNEPYRLPGNGFKAPSGKKFAGWSVDSPSGETVNAGSYYIFTEDVAIVYAVWVDKKTTTTTTGTNTTTTGTNTTTTGTTTNESAAASSAKALEWSYQSLKPVNDQKYMTYLMDSGLVKGASNKYSN